MHVPSAMTIMPPEPSDEPGRLDLLIVESERLDSAPVSTLVEMPPGMMALSCASADDAAAILVDELGPRIADLDFVNARAG